MTSGAPADGATCIILTYDRLRMLRAAVASALAQDHPDVEVLVVDNGSGPETVAWLEAVDDPRLRVLRLPENRPPSAARNAGLRAASRPWVGFLDDDDLWAPDKVSRMIAAAEHRAAPWVYCGCVFVDEDDVVIGGRPAPTVAEVGAELPTSYVIPGGLSGVMWRKDVLPADPIDEQMSYCDDWDIALQLLRVGMPAAVDAPLVGYRQHGGAWSGNVGPLFDEFDMVAKKHADLRRARSVKRYQHPRYVGGQALRAGASLDAARWYLRAVRLGDWASIPRLLATALPATVQAAIRRRVLSDAAWMASGQRWIDRNTDRVARDLPRVSDEAPPR